MVGMPTTSRGDCGGMVGTALCAFAHPTAPASGAQTYRTTPDVNPALRRGGLMSFFRKQRASRPV
ncbi:hypothetical protein ABIF81_007445 [Bradyrhizobium daqingense]